MLCPQKSVLKNFVKKIMHPKKGLKQAGAELCQAQASLS